MDDLIIRFRHENDGLFGGKKDVQPNHIQLLPK